MPVTNAQIPGSTVSSFGGILTFAPFQNARAAASGSVWHDLDVANWSMKRIFFGDDTTHTGTWGAQGWDVTCETAIWSAEVIWDANNPPDIVQRWASNLAQSNNQALFMNQGVQLALYLGNQVPNSPEAEVADEYYFIPSSKVLTQTPIVDAGNKKVVRIKLEGHANSAIFHLPFESARLAAYNTHLATRGFTY